MIIGNGPSLFASEKDCREARDYYKTMYLKNNSNRMSYSFDCWVPYGKWLYGCNERLVTCTKIVDTKEDCLSVLRSMSNAGHRGFCTPAPAGTEAQRVKVAQRLKDEKRQADEWAFREKLSQLYTQQAIQSVQQQAAMHWVMACNFTDLAEDRGPQSCQHVFGVSPFYESKGACDTAVKKLREDVADRPLWNVTAYCYRR